MPVMTSNTTPSPYVASASAADIPDHDAYRAFDQSSNFEWMGGGGSPWWLQFDWGAGTASILGSYTVAEQAFFAILFPARTPNSWQMQGANSLSDRFNHGDLVLITPTTVSSALHFFDASDVGNLFEITGGAGFTVGVYTILSVSVGGVATLDQVAGVAGSTSGLYTSKPWFLLDTVTGQTNWVDSPVRSFTCDVQTTKYRFFRLYVKANNGDATYCLVTELGLNAQFHHFH